MTDSEYQDELKRLMIEAHEQSAAVGSLRDSIFSLVWVADRRSRRELVCRIMAAQAELSRLDMTLIDWSRPSLDIGFNGLVMTSANVSVKAAARNLVATQLSQNAERVSILEMQVLSRATLYLTAVVLTVSAVAAYAAVRAIL